MKRRIRGLYTFNILKGCEGKSKMQKGELAKKLIKEKRDLFICPVCGGEITIQEAKSLVCLNRHTFDISKRGYINMLLRPVKTDYNKEMLESRNIICKSGFFDPMLSGVSELILEKVKENNLLETTILDAGCGEGSHLSSILRNLKGKVNTNLLGIGIDISKEGINIASRDYTNIIWCVADLAKIPLKDKQFDIVLNILSPANYVEFTRILKDNGILIKVVPGNKYLTELRDLFFDENNKKTYSNDKVIQHFSDNYQIIDHKKILYNVRLPNENTKHLLKMTPLSWNVENERIEKVLNMGIKDITVDFEIIVGKNKP